MSAKIWLNAFVIGCQRLVPLVRDTRLLRGRLGDVGRPPRLVRVPVIRRRPELVRRIPPMTIDLPRRRRRVGRWLAAGLPDEIPGTTIDR